MRVTLESARRSDDGLTLEFSFVGEDWQAQPLDERWQVVATGVAEHMLALEEVLPRLSTEHPRLRSWQEKRLLLMFASAPADSAAVERALRAVHDEHEYGLFSSVYDAPDLTFGVGQLAHGPVSLLERYAAVLEQYRMRPTRLPSVRRGAPASPPTFILRLDWSEGWFAENFVIAHTFSAHRLP